ncbi:MAG: protoheme IX farnesyltransferase [Saprospiraceae bacterium]|uniref:Protoheme IX farnesyltransferase n=1 Tax=Candidatus Opimibacter skivensis TaxID=2982028 RepID=A0A9D7XMU1_9BACT|nr:protoheme IX farnesyltransferase [Candidatus Opimibacter skivensis]
MKRREDVHVRAISITFRDWLQDLELLVKFRLSSFVVFSSVVAYLIAAGTNFHIISFLLLTAGGFLITFSANILNEILEADYDKMMERTSNRPLAAGRWNSSSAVVLAGLTCLVGIILLALLNPLTSFLGMVSLVTYAFLYTPLKRYSTVSVVIGAIPGALPAMIGMIAFDGVITPACLFLFAIQFIWQFPHFWSIGFLSFDQYQRAGYKLLPVENGKIDTRLGLQAFIYAMLLLPVIFIGFSAGLVTSFGAIGIGLLSLYFMWRAWTFYRRFDKDSAKALMFSSFIYLPAALMILWWSM